jgi:hypothetical protein
MLTLRQIFREVFPRAEELDVIASQELREDFEICNECIALDQQESKPDGD